MEMVWQMQLFRPVTCALEPEAANEEDYQGSGSLFGHTLESAGCTIEWGNPETENRTLEIPHIVSFPPPPSLPKKTPSSHS
jgi:hypothetical protein